MSSTVSYVQASTALLAAALRDPAPILNMETFWHFMQVVEQASGSLTDGERTNSAYQDHVACYDRVYRLHHDMTPIGEDWMRLGPQLIEAMAAYAEQAAVLFALLLDHRPVVHLAPLLQEFEQVMQQVVQEVREVPSQAPVQHALVALRQCQEDAISACERREPHGP